MEPIIPPHDADAERALLGAVLLNRDALVVIAHVITPDDFYLRSHHDIYAAMLHLYQQRTPPDVRTVAAELKQRQQLEGLIAFGSQKSTETRRECYVCCKHQRV